MSDDRDLSKCIECGEGNFEPTVQFGSYVLRCSSCGTGHVATSFLALRTSEGIWAAYRDPGHGVRPSQDQLIARGTMLEIYEVVSRIASSGERVVLRNDA